MNRKVLTNSHIICEKSDFYGSIVIEDSIITDIIKDRSYNSGIDMKGAWLAPGIIDIHSDYIEKEFHPRPNTGFPASLALRYLDTRAVTSGITTLFNGISYRESNDTERSIDTGIEISDILEEYIEKKYFLAKHYIHARIDITDEKILNELDKILKYKSLRIAVYNDHTPGTRQFRDITKYTDYTSDRSGKSRNEVLGNISILQEKASVRNNIILRISERLKKTSLVIGSHDDTTIEHIDEAIEHGAVFSEFPTTFEAAEYAKEKGLFTVMGAPNLVLGRSQSGNISCKEAIEKNLVDSLCSDYHFPSMLSSAMHLIYRGFTPSDAFNMITINPAKIVKMDNFTGSIRIGKSADIVIFDTIHKEPIVKEVFVEGESVFRINESLWENI